MNGIKLDSDAIVVVNLVFPATQRSMTSTREKACSALACIRSLNPSLVFLLLGRERRRRRRWRRQCHVERTLKLCFRRSRPASSTSPRCSTRYTSASPPTAPRGLPSRGTTWVWRSATPWLLFSVAWMRMELTTLLPNVMECYFDVTFPTFDGILRNRVLLVVFSILVIVRCHRTNFPKKKTCTPSIPNYKTFGFF